MFTLYKIAVLSVTMVAFMMTCAYILDYRLAYIDKVQQEVTHVVISR